MSSGYPQANAPPGDDIDEIIRMAEAGIRPPKKEASLPAHAAPTPLFKPEPAAKPNPPAQSAPVPEIPTAGASEEKKVKKDKDKNNRMVYSDNEVSPEEKMAKMLRYAFVSDGKDDTTLVDANATPGVAGVVDQ